MRAVIDGLVVRDKEMLHEILKQSLSLPEWYGENLDALYDCLTDPGMEAEIVLLHVDELSATLGTYAEKLIELLEDAAEENVGIQIVEAIEDEDPYDTYDEDEEEE